MGNLRLTKIESIVEIIHINVVIAVVIVIIVHDSTKEGGDENK